MWFHRALVRIGLRRENKKTVSVVIVKFVAHSAYDVMTKAEAIDHWLANNAPGALLTDAWVCHDDFPIPKSATCLIKYRLRATAEDVVLFKLKFNGI